MQPQKRYTILLALLMCCILGLWAAPARRVSITVTQPDGTRLELTQYGDEHFHCLVTEDGVPIIREGKGYYYAHIGEGGIVSSGVLAHEAVQRNEQEQAIAEETTRIWQAQPPPMQRVATKRSAATETTTNIPTRGDVYVPVILVQYADVKFSPADPKKTFEGRINGDNYLNEGGYGSIKEYFIEQSNGLFTPHFDIIGPITLGNDTKYYGGNDKQGTDLRPQEMVSEACRKAYSEEKADFTRYDNNGDGYVDIVYIIYAGYGEASYPDRLENTIWPHQWELDSPLNLGGVKVECYACNNELDGYTGSKLDGIGTFCHEFSHCLGLPDFYPTDGSAGFGMSNWSLMDYGCYNNNGHTPCAYTAYEKSSLGWLSLTELDTPTHVSLKPLHQGGEAYKIVNDANADEYYVVEYICQEGWNKYAPAEGMLVTHVDYDAEAWRKNTVNNDIAHPRVTIIPADGRRTTQNLAGDTYPGKSTELTATSTPAAKVYKGEYMNKDITHIAKEGATITFNFMQGALRPPLLHAPSHILPTAFTLTWDAAEQADAYDIRLDMDEGGTSGATIHTVRTTECSYRFEGLHGGRYLCRVRSIYEGMRSHYSEPISVHLVDTILPLASNAPEIVIRHDSIYIEAADSTRIYYTIDGLYPTPYSTLYTSPFTTTEKVTIRAIACREGHRNSPIAQVVNWFEHAGATYRITSTDSLRVVVSASTGGNNEEDYCGHYTFESTIQHDTTTYTLEGFDTGAFRNAIRLRSVVVEDCPVRHVGDSLFHGCIALNAVVWEAATALPDEVFDDDSDGNLLVYLPDTAVAPSSLTRKPNAAIIRDGHSGPLTLDATSTFYCPRPFTAERVTYLRSFSQSTGIGTSSGWETIVLPFDVQHITHATKGTITPFGIEGDHHCWLATPKDNAFAEATEIRANMPYIIALPNNKAYGDHSLSGVITFAADNALIHSTKSHTTERSYPLVTERAGSTSAITLYFVPTYDLIEASSEVYVLNVNSTFNNYAPGSVFVPGQYATLPFSVSIVIGSEGKSIPLYRIALATGDRDDDPLPTLSITSQEGTIYITSSVERVIDLYDAVGRKLQTVCCPVGTTAVGPLDEGLYIIGGKKIYVQR